MDAESKIIYVMGVSGCGKTTIGRALAENLKVLFIDADDHHPPSNIEKMSKGMPLDDEDRYPWLDEINALANARKMEGCVIACSALKKAYRDRLIKSLRGKVTWVYLKGSYDHIFQRLIARSNHFMQADMLQSQFEILEEPETAIEIDISDSPELIITKITAELNDQ